MALFEKMRLEYSDQEPCKEAEFKGAIERYRRNIRNNLTKMRSYEMVAGKICAIILTDTSAVPFGWALKEGYKIVNPDREVPKFLRINVKLCRDYFSGHKIGVAESKATREYFDRLVNGWEQKLRDFGLKGKDIAIFDEVEFAGNTLRVAKSILEKAGVGKIILLTGGCGCHYPVWKNMDNVYNPIKEDAWTEQTKIVGKEHFPDAKILIRDMKELGRQAGEEVLKILEKQTLEKF